VQLPERSVGLRVPPLPATTLSLLAEAHSLRVERLARTTGREAKAFIVRMRERWELEGRLLAEGHGDLDVCAFESRGGFFVLRDTADAIVATMGYSRVDDSVCELTKLYVDPAYQGLGFAGALHREMENEARADGYESVVLDTLDIFTVAARAYRKWGYVLCGRQDIPRSELRAGSRALTSLYFIKSLRPTEAFAPDCLTRATGMAVEFTQAGELEYPRAYNRAIRSYSGWQEMLHLHLDAISEDARVVLDVGGGSGRMTEKVLETGRSALTLDLSPLMLHLAANDNRIDRSRLHLCDALDPRLGASRIGRGISPPERSIDHVLSHSVLWMLPDPGAFFEVYARLLRPGGRLSLSTIVPAAENLDESASNAHAQQFLRELTADMHLELQSGRPFGLDAASGERVAQMMIQANESFSTTAKHAWTSEHLSVLAGASGLRLVEGSHRVGYGQTMGFWVFEKA
jgi:SAM-dependent methyltransferase/ribosomal protein S18 acetylase RimI-like enzyme